MNQFLGFLADNRRVRESYLEELKEICSLETVSSIEAQRAFDKAVEWLVNRMNRTGIETQVLKAGTTGKPAIYGEIKGESSRTLLLYNHYDVQSPEPLEAWQTDPFLPVIKDGIFWARGVADNKGSLLSRIHAIELFRLMGRKLPTTVKFLIEGEEEVGSPNLEYIIAQNEKLLDANACIWESGRRDDRGRPTASLGNKGICILELHARVATSDSHSSFAGIYPNALWRLTWALSRLKDPDGRVRVPGFYEDVLPLSPADKQVCRTLPVDLEEQKRRMGLPRLLPGESPFAINRTLFYEPTINIQGISGGYTGPGHKTVNPATALARVDCRLVNNMDPQITFERVRDFIRKEGFDDISVVYASGALPARTPLDHPFVEVVRSSGRQTYGQEFIFYPTSPGTGPRHLFRRLGNPPIVGIGVSHAGSNVHAPNENIRIEDYFLGSAHIAALLELLGTYQIT